MLFNVAYIWDDDSEGILSYHIYTRRFSNNIKGLGNISRKSTSWKCPAYITKIFYQELPIPRQHYDILKMCSTDRVVAIENVSVKL